MTRDWRQIADEIVRFGEAMDGFLLSLTAKPALALLRRRNPSVGNNPRDDRFMVSTELAPWGALYCFVDRGPFDLVGG